MFRVKLMGGFIAFDAQSMEQTANGRIETDFAVQLEQQIGLRRSFVEFDTTTRSDILRQRFTKLAHFNQRSVRIARERVFRRCRQLQKNCIVFL
jgi:hypothetical protein